MAELQAATSDGDQDLLLRPVRGITPTGSGRARTLMALASVLGAAGIVAVLAWKTPALAGMLPAAAAGDANKLTMNQWDLEDTIEDAILRIPQDKPNFLFIHVDDLGYGDVDICPEDVPYEQCSLRPANKARAQHLRTPRMKQMAKEGMIFTNFYAPRSICSPSREATLSGRDPTRYGAIDNHMRIYASSVVRGGMPRSEVTTANYLKNAGYKTGYAGKWHMGLGNGTDPYHYAAWKYGYDEVDFFIEGSNGEPCPKGSMNPVGDDNIYHMCSFDHVLRRSGDDGEVIEQPIRWENITARILNSTLAFIRRHGEKKEPWFFHHAFTTVHMPWVLSRHFVSDPVLKLWTDMVSETDWAVGVMLDELKKTGQENTVVLLTSDNGPYLEYASSYCPSNCRMQKPSWQRDDKPENFGCAICGPSSVSLAGPLSGGKGQTWEGGLRVPAVWWWPKHIPGGTVNPLVSSSLDFLPTSAALAGVQIDPSITLDGRNIAQSLLSRPGRMPKGSFHYWCGATLMAVRINEYKVMWVTQKWVNKDAEETPEDLCGGNGKCCVGSPSRLCTCGGLGWEKFVDFHDPPVVVNLMSNPSEDLASRIQGKEAKQVIMKAEAMRLEKLRSVAKDMKIPHSEILNERLLATAIKAKPNMMQVDVFTPAPQAYLLKEFKPYQHCSTTKFNDSSTATCFSRLPCLSDQPGYKGPFEYVLPDGTKCGGFKQPSGSSYFPEYLLPSVRAWQDMAGLADKPYICLAANNTAANMAACKRIADYGLKNIPTGETFSDRVIWDEPYPA